MKESTKRIIDCLMLLALGVPVAILWFDYTNNQHPSKIWTVLLTFDIPFAIAALIWLGWRFLRMLPKGESTNRIIDWLTLIPLGYLPALAVWGHYTHNSHLSTIWLVLSVIDIPLALASGIWLGVRMDKTKGVHWFIYDIAMVPRRATLFILGLCAAVTFIKWLLS